MVTLKRTSAMYMECAISAVSMMPDFNFSESCMPPKKIKASDPCCLPTQKLLRTNFVAYVWKHARESRPVAFGPDGDGFDDRRLKIQWFTAPNAPTNFDTEESNLEDETDDETDAEETSSHEEEEQQEEMDDN